jgi:hypothetical protein
VWEGGGGGIGAGVPDSRIERAESEYFLIKMILCLAETLNYSGFCES